MSKLPECTGFFLDRVRQRSVLAGHSFLACQASVRIVRTSASTLTMNNQQRLKKKIETQIKRIKKAKHDRPNLLSQTVYIGTLGLVMVLPIVGGAYLGHWLDGMVEGYSTRWTLSLLFTGLVIGIFNVYFLIKDK